MTFVNTRPEVPKYVAAYSDEMMATFLLPAGVTSVASIRYKDKDRLPNETCDKDKTHMEEVLSGKMQYNPQVLTQPGFWADIKTMFRTVYAVLGKDETVS